MKPIEKTGVSFVSPPQPGVCVPSEGGVVFTVPATEGVYAHQVKKPDGKKTWKVEPFNNDSQTNHEEHV